MLNVKKLVLVIISVMVISLFLGTMNVNATTVRTITANTSSDTTNTTNTENTTDNTNTTNTRTITSTSDYTNNTSNTNSNTNTNTNTTSNKSSLPYTGTKSSVLFVGIALGLSAIYAYKKVSEYKNI